MRRVVITGMGVTCGTADNKEAFAEVCLKGERMLSPCQVFSTDGLATPYFGVTKSVMGNRSLSLIESSLKEMMTDAEVTREDIAGWGQDCPMFVGSLIFASDYFYQHSLAKSRGEQDDFLAHSYEFVDKAKEILGLQGQVEHVSSACASGTTAVGMGLDYIRGGLCDCAVAGAFDPLSLVTACGFNSLHNMSSELCNPFDENRDGLNIGEGAAFFLLEEEEHARTRGAKIICELAGAAISNDAYHLTSPDPKGEEAKAVMLGAIADAGLQPEDIDYINAHGTGTKVNDIMELQTMERIFGNLTKDVYYSSTKGSTGHCMGAAGAIELAACIIALEQQKYLPMPYVKTPLQTGASAPSLKSGREPIDLKINAILSNSFAFSGHNAAIVIKRYEV